ncbi:MAG TPA: chemotaxis protein CheD [Spirochaetota bacterium]|nr:chemotaxis protein CheD [Spirochaetota bacterium]HQO40068.1 chemotaxis protein CheD [Spirochaetota bacterium]
MSFELINIGIADLGVGKSPSILRTILGSCIGICIYDTSTRIGGLSHIMLPTSKKNAANPRKYADSAIPLLVEDMMRAGAMRNSMIAKIIGGAAMFKHTENSFMGDIGRNNIVSVQQILSGMNLRIVSSDVGGDYGRTIDFYLESGEVKIKTIGRDTKII